MPSLGQAAPGLPSIDGCGSLFIGGYGFSVQGGMKVADGYGSPLWGGMKVADGYRSPIWSGMVAGDYGSPVRGGMKERIRMPAGFGSSKDRTRSQIFPCDISVLFLPHHS